MSDDVDWNGARVARLRALWAEGLSMSAIGRALGISKNSVVGKVHRLHLPSRPSPIRRGEGVAKPASVRLKLPAGGSDSRRGSKALRGDTLGALGAAPAAVAAFVSPAPRAALPDWSAPRAALPAASQRKSAPCCWPIGDPRAKGFRFCEAAGVPGRSYCAEHEAIAWARAPSVFLEPRERSAAQLAWDAERRRRLVGVSRPKVFG